MNELYQKSFFGGKPAGFTLIELLVVVLIIGILAAVALPKYEVAVAKSRYVELIPLVHLLQRERERYQMATGEVLTSTEDMDVMLPADCKVYVSDSWAYCKKFKFSLGWSNFVIGENDRNSYMISSDGSKTCRSKTGDDVGAAVCRGLGGVAVGTGLGSCSLASLCDSFKLP